MWDGEGLNPQESPQQPRVCAFTFQGFNYGQIWPENIKQKIPEINDAQILNYMYLFVCFCSAF
jgi:hypothetical protein